MAPSPSVWLFIRRTARVVPALLVLLALTVSRASAGPLPDGTRVPVRLVTFISSQDSRDGDPIEFVVTSNVVVDGRVVIARGARVMGLVVKARRAKWRFSSNRHARLAFVFTYTMASDGELVRLRGPASRRPDDRVVVDRDRFHHDFQWAGPIDTFDAYVDSNHDE